MQYAISLRLLRVCTFAPLRFYSNNTRRGTLFSKRRGPHRRDEVNKEKEQSRKRAASATTPFKEEFPNKYVKTFEASLIADAVNPTVQRRADNDGCTSSRKNSSNSESASFPIVSASKSLRKDGAQPAEASLAALLQKHQVMRQNYSILQSHVQVWESFAELCISSIGVDGKALSDIVSVGPQQSNSKTTVLVEVAYGLPPRQPVKTNEACASNESVRTAEKVRVIEFTRAAAATLFAPIQIPFPLEISSLMAMRDASVEDSSAEEVQALRRHWHQEWEQLATTESRRLPSSKPPESEIRAPSHSDSVALGLFTPSQCAALEMALGLPRVSSPPSSARSPWSAGPKEKQLEEACQSFVRRQRVVQEVFGLLKTLAFFRWVKEDYRLLHSSEEGNTFADCIMKLLAQIKRKKKAPYESDSSLSPNDPAWIRMREHLRSAPLDVLPLDPNIENETTTPLKTHILDVLFLTMYRYVLTNFSSLQPRDRATCFRISLIWPLWQQQTDLFALPLAFWYAGLELEGLRADAISASLSSNPSAVTSEPVGAMGMNAVEIDYHSFSSEMRILSQSASSECSLEENSGLEALEFTGKHMLLRLKKEKEVDFSETLLPSENQVQVLQRLVLRTTPSSTSRQSVALALLFQWLSEVQKLYSRQAKDANWPDDTSPEAEIRTQVMTPLLDALYIAQKQNLLGRGGKVDGLETTTVNSAVQELLNQESNNANTALSLSCVLSQRAMLCFGAMNAVSQRKGKSAARVKWSAAASKADVMTSWNAFREAVTCAAAPLLCNGLRNGVWRGRDTLGDSTDFSKREMRWSQLVLPLMHSGVFSVKTHMGKLMLRSLLEELRAFPSLWKKRMMEVGVAELTGKGSVCSDAEVQDSFSMERFTELGVCATLFCLANRKSLNVIDGGGNKTEESSISRPDEEVSTEILFEKLLTKFNNCFAGCSTQLCRGCWGASTTDLSAQLMGMKAAKFMLNTVFSSAHTESKDPLKMMDASCGSLRHAEQVLFTHIFTKQMKEDFEAFRNAQEAILSRASRCLKRIDLQDKCLQQWAFLLLKDEMEEESGQRDGSWSRQLSWRALESGLIEIVKGRVERRTVNLGCPDSEGSNEDAPLENMTDLLNVDELSVILRLLSRMRARQGVFLLHHRQPGVNHHVSTMVEMVSSAVANEKNTTISVLKRSPRAAADTEQESHVGDATAMASTQESSQGAASPRQRSIPLTDVEMVLKACVRHWMDTLPLACQLDAVFVGLLSITELPRVLPFTASMAELSGKRKATACPVDTQWGRFVKLVAGFVVVRNTPFLLADSGGWQFDDAPMPWQMDGLDSAMHSVIGSVSNTLRVILQKIVQLEIQNLSPAQEKQQELIQRTKNTSEESGPDHAVKDDGVVDSGPTPFPHGIVSLYCLSSYTYLRLKEKGVRHGTTANSNSSEPSRATDRLLSVLYGVLMHTSRTVLIGNERIFPDELLWCLSYVIQALQKNFLPLERNAEREALQKSWWPDVKNSLQHRKPDAASVEEPEVSSTAEKKEEPPGRTSPFGVPTSYEVALTQLPHLNRVVVPPLSSCYSNEPSSIPVEGELDGPLTPLQTCQYFTATYWPYIWNRLHNEIRPLVDACKTKGNMRMATNLVFGVYTLQAARAPINISNFPGDAILHRAAVVSTNYPYGGQDGDTSGSASRKMTVSNVSSLAVAASLLPHNIRSSSVIAQQMRSVREICSTDELQRFLLILRHWGIQHRNLDYQHHSPSHPTESSNADGPQLDAFEVPASPGQRTRILGTITHNVAPPSFRTAWASLARRLCGTELTEWSGGEGRKGKEKTVAAEQLRNLVALALHTGAILECADTLIFRQLLSFLLYGHDDVEEPQHFVLCATLLRSFTCMVEACALAMEDRQEYSFLLREKFLRCLPRSSLLDVESSSDSQLHSQRQLTERTTHLCLFVEALGKLCIADTALWDTVRQTMQQRWIPEVERHLEPLPAQKWKDELYRSLKWSTMNAGFLNHF